MESSRRVGRRGRSSGGGIQWLRDGGTGSEAAQGSTTKTLAPKTKASAGILIKFFDPLSKRPTDTAQFRSWTCPIGIETPFLTSFGTFERSRVSYPSGKLIFVNSDSRTYDPIRIRLDGSSASLLDCVGVFLDYEIRSFLRGWGKRH